MNSEAPPIGTARRVDPRHLRLWLCAVLFGALVGIANVPETGLRSLWARLRSHPVASHVTVVAIDDKTLSAIGEWPFPRSTHAQLIDRLFALGAERVFVNLNFSSAQSAREDGVLAQTLVRHRGRVFLMNRVVEDQVGRRSVVLPHPQFANVSAGVNVSYTFDANGAVSRLPYAFENAGVFYPGISAVIAGSVARGGSFPVDTSIDLRSVPVVSMADVLDGRVAADAIRGRQVIFGATSEQLQDIFLVYPYGRLSSAVLFALGAETLFEGVPRDLGWLPIFLYAALTSALIGLLRRPRDRILLLLLAGFTGTVLPLLLPTYIVASVLPGLALVSVLIASECRRLLRDTLRARATTNQVSGLRNLVALRQIGAQPGRRLVVARIHNFAEATAALPPDDESVLVAQIASRLKLGMTGSELYHGDNGVFSWLADDHIATVGERLDALHALFRSPVTVSGQNVDLVVTFGVDDDDERSVANRLGSALVAAAEAAADGVRWREFDKTKLADAAWKLSLLSQLDAAIDDGDLWVAYQPKLDLASRRLIGAEALVRWTHPEKGAISPIEFVAAAEQHNRIEKLTMHVLDRAVLACATINAHGIPFGIAVNLSTRLLENRSIVDAVATALADHKLEASKLTLEITETATLTSATSLDVLGELRALGLRISIDDYGTGLSTLDYLKKIPASEIKIDRSFVASMLSGGSDLLMVNSTIQLAHSLGHVVVAEGVETDEVLARLTELQCDIAQGYRIGRPMTFQDLARRLLAERRCAA